MNYSWELELLNLLTESELTPVPEGISDIEAGSFERVHGITLPAKLVAWLKLINGSFVGTQELLGIGDRTANLTITRVYSYYPEWTDFGWLPIATDGCGNYFVVITRPDCERSHPVAFVDTADDPSSLAYIVASDIPHFLTFFIRDALGVLKWNWPFDQAQMLSIDPDITKCSCAPLPWES